MARWRKATPAVLVLVVLYVYEYTSVSTFGGNTTLAGKNTFSSPSIFDDDAITLNLISAEYHESEENLNSTSGASTKATKRVAFVHFHKAGGTSMVRLFTSRFQSWEPSRNGNPWRYLDTNNQSSRYLLHYWNYNAKEMEEFLSEQPSAQFFAIEWNFFTALKRQEIATHFDLITCLRDPYSRFVSNLFVNHYHPKYKAQPKLWMKQNFTWAFNSTNKHRQPWNDFHVNFNKPNYYVAFLNGLADQDYDWRTLNETHHLAVAKERLHWFRALLILDLPETHAAIGKWFPGNETSTLMPAYNVNAKTNKTIGMTRDEFNDLNQLDVKLYEYAVDLALSRLPRDES